MISGWQDILLPWMLEDHAALQAAGRDVQLVIGPWTHTAPGLAAAGDRLGLAFLRAHLLGDERMVRPEQVSVFVTGERAGGGWRALPDGRPRIPASGRFSSRGRDACRRAGAPRLRPPGAIATSTTPRTRRRRSAARCCSSANAVVDNRAARGAARRPHVHDRAAGRDGRGDRAGPGAAVRPREPPVLRRVRPRLRRRPFRRFAERDRRARARRARPVRPEDGPTALTRSRSTCGRSGTGSPRRIGSASRSPPARTRATPATRARARTRSRRRGSSRSRSRCSTAPSTPPP